MKVCLVANAYGELSLKLSTPHCLSMSSLRPGEAPSLLIDQFIISVVTIVNLDLHHFLSLLILGSNQSFESCGDVSV